MPLGGNNRHVVNDGAPLIVPVPPQSLAPAAPTLAERQAGAQIWTHRTIAAADWVGELVEVTFGDLVTAFSIYSPAGVVLYVGLDRPDTSSTPGTYDAFHPGAGILTSPIPATRVLSLSTGTGGPAGGIVEVYGFAGSYAIGA